MEIEKIRILSEKITKKHPDIIIKVASDLIDTRIVHFYLHENEKSRTKGFASDINAEVALTKAYAEFVERKIFLKTIERTSSGFAAHASKEQAYISAQHELIERDSFLISWIINHHPYWLTEVELTQINSVDTKQIKEALGLHNMDYKIGIVAKTGDVLTAIGLLHSCDNSFGFAIDCKSGNDFNFLLTNLLQSICYYATMIINRKKQDKIYNLLTEENVKKVEDHLEFYLNPKNINHAFFNGSKDILILPEIESIESKEFDNLDSAICLSVVQCFSKFSQNYFVGKTTDDNINFQRLKKVTSQEIIINKNLHPLP